MKRLFSVIPLLTGAALLLMGTLPLMTTSYTIQPDESTMRVEGTSTVHDWSCPVGTIDGSFEIDTEATETTPIASLDRVHITVPVEQIDCDKSKMNRKLRDALQANRYPEVMYTLQSVEMQPLPDSSDGWFEAQTTGELIIAGTRNQVEMTVKGQKMDDGRLRFVGQKALKLSDFNVDRPSAMLGTIKTGDEVTVYFDVVGAP